MLLEEWLYANPYVLSHNIVPSVTKFSTLKIYSLYVYNFSIFNFKASTARYSLSNTQRLNFKLLIRRKKYKKTTTKNTQIFT